MRISKPHKLSLPRRGLRGVLLLAALSIGATATALLGQNGTAPANNAKPAAPAATPAKSDADKDNEPPKEVILRADHALYDGKLKKTRFLGHVTIRQKGEDFTLEADNVLYDEQTDTAEGTGNLKMYDPDTTITGDLIVANFQTRQSSLTGNVVLISHGTETKENKQADKNLSFKERYKKKKTVMTCDRIDYWYREKRAEATGNLKFSQEDKHGTAQKATFYEKEDRIVLEGDVTVTNEKQETLRCQKATIDNREDTIEAEGISSTFFLEEESGGKGGKQEQKSAGGAQKPAGKTGGGQSSNGGKKSGGGK